jgi:hypothetical protein
LLEIGDRAIIDRGFQRIEAPVIPKLDVAPEKKMSPIAHSPMTLSPLAAV